MRLAETEALLTSPLPNEGTQPVLKSLTSILATPLTLTAPDELFVSKICAFMLLQVGTGLFVQVCADTNRACGWAWDRLLQHAFYCRLLSRPVLPLA